ncbi:hypothetical protein [Breoghania sp.]|uniref:hypothetical protein n=1 Tax=Breoghania sp. TaxID=2065378 RepID=UPI002602E05D|nr:hypothetical protein [Breoghania sp.]MDJ0930420.1 hypothetical protein [Breoghania sp.]
MNLEKTLFDYHWDQSGQGYFLTASDANDLVVRPKNDADEAAPNANGIMART